MIIMIIKKNKNKKNINNLQVILGNKSFLYLRHMSLYLGYVIFFPRSVWKLQKSCDTKV